MPSPYKGGDHSRFPHSSRATWPRSWRSLTSRADRSCWDHYDGHVLAGRLVLAVLWRSVIRPLLGGRADAADQRTPGERRFVERLLDRPQGGRAGALGPLHRAVPDRRRPKPAYESHPSVVVASPCSFVVRRGRASVAAPAASAADTSCRDRGSWAPVSGPGEEPEAEAPFVSV